MVLNLQITQNVLHIFIAPLICGDILIKDIISFFTGTVESRYMYIRLIFFLLESFTFPGRRKEGKLSNKAEKSKGGKGRQSSKVRQSL